jgi:hypothetical protein
MAETQRDRVITDEDIRNGLTKEELLSRVIPRIEKLFNKESNE